MDVSGNGMGNAGAIALGKALQINHTLTSIKWDENSIGLMGFINVDIYFYYLWLDWFRTWSSNVEGFFIVWKLIFIIRISLGESNGWGIDLHLDFRKGRWNLPEISICSKCECMPQMSEAMWIWTLAFVPLTAENVIWDNFRLYFIISAKSRKASLSSW